MKTNFRGYAPEANVTKRTDRVRVPDLHGRLGYEAMEQLLAAGLHLVLYGKGRVVSQTLTAGSLVERGSRVKVDLGQPESTTSENRWESCVLRPDSPSGRAA